MGRLRFTLVNTILWITLVLSILLSENFAVFNANPMKGFNIAPGYILSFVIILFLVFYYVLEHKKNGLKFDKVLLPLFCACGALMIFNVFRQGHREFINYDNTGNFVVDFSFNDQLSSALQIVIWLAVIYALIFVYNRFRLNKESIRWIAKIYVVLTLAFSFIDFIYEFNVIRDIFAGTYVGEGVEFFLGNANVWGLLIFVGIITAIILSFKRFSWYYFSCMLVLLTYLTFTTSATAIYVSWLSVIAYILYEILSKLKVDKKMAIRNLIIFISVSSFIVLSLTILILCKVPMFVNFWSFVSNSIISKDYFTMTGRTHLWRRILELLAANPMDLIFGLGHGTGTTILRNYVNFTLKSAHNGLLEILLRYGIIGLLIYIAFLGLVIFSLVKHIKKKNYRFAYIYGVGFVAIMLHSLAESSTIFTPNIGGLFFGFIFVLPIINIIQEKRFNSLKEQLLLEEVEVNHDDKKAFLVFIVSLALSIVIGKIASAIFALDTLCNILVALTVLCTIFFILSLMNYKSIINFNNYMFRNYQTKVRKDQQ